MAYPPDENTAKYSKNQMNAKLWNGMFNYWNPEVPSMVREGCSSAISLSSGLSPRPIIPSEQTWMSTIISPVVWFQSNLATITAIPHDLIGVNDLLSWDASDDWWRAALHGLFLPQHLGNFCEPWWWA